jgi:hypothetical protein
MTNSDIFSDGIFNIPIKRDGSDLYTFLSAIYKNYLKTINKFNGNIKNGLTLNLKEIEKECSLILKALELYLNGFPSQAFMEVKKCLTNLNKLELLEIQQGDYGSGRNELYRIRTAANKSLKKEELFHVPFQLREKVATQRYSIPGLPCLYLADSTFVCWEELGRPDISNIHVSKFDLSKSKFKLLYLNNNTDQMRKRCFNSNKDGIYINQLVKYLSYWPLLAACSVIVDKPAEVFKPEYIIPQLVLQWVVLDGNLDGIQYRSNRVKSSSHNIGTFSNIVIPVKRSADRGFCSILSKRIKMTNPISWQLLDISDPSKKFAKKSIRDISIESYRKASFIEVIDQEKTPYLESKFGIMEEKLRTMPSFFIL